MVDRTAIVLNSAGQIARIVHVVGEANPDTKLNDPAFNLALGLQVRVDKQVYDAQANPNALQTQRNVTALALSLIPAGNLSISAGLQTQITALDAVLNAPVITAPDAGGAL